MPLDYLSSLMTDAIPPLPIAIVGLNFGRFILEALAREPANRFFRLAAVCDTDSDKCTNFARTWGVKAFSSLDALLTDPEIPAIGLFTGPEGRADLLRKILMAGKDVMTTKPFERSPTAAQRILETARAQGRIIHLNSPAPRVTGYLEKIHSWREDYALGRPIHCRGEVLASYREAADGRWLDDPAACPAAPIFRLGIYVLNDLIHLFGPVRDVQVQSSRLFTGRPTADTAQLGMTFCNGALGSIFSTFCVDSGQYYANSLILHFERGTIHRNLGPFAYGMAGACSRLRLITTDGKNNTITEDWEQNEGAGDYQWEEFFRAVTTRDTSSMPIENTVHGLEVIAAMARAEVSHRTEPVQTS